MRVFKLKSLMGQTRARMHAMRPDRWVWKWTGSDLPVDVLEWLITNGIDPATAARLAEGDALQIPHNPRGLVLPGVTYGRPFYPDRG